MKKQLKQIKQLIFLGKAVIFAILVAIITGIVFLCLGLWAAAFMAIVVAPLYIGIFIAILEDTFW